MKKVIQVAVVLVLDSGEKILKEVYCTPEDDKEVVGFCAQIAAFGAFDSLEDMNKRESKVAE